MNRSSPATEPAFSIHLDVIRGLAALVVFFGHARELFLPSPTHILLGVDSGTLARSTTAQTTNWGHQAVIVFFVLSGYLVGGSIIRQIRCGTWSWSKYIVQRLTRLWIVLIPALMIGWGIDRLGTEYFGGKGSIYDAPPGQTQVGPHLASRLTPAVLIGNAFFSQTIKVETAGTNAALWSLAYEFWYYVAFPLLAMTLWATRRPKERLLYGLALACLLFFIGSDITLYFLIWLLGVVAAAIPSRIPASWSKPATATSLLFFTGLNLCLRKLLLPTPLSDGILALGFFALLYCLLHRTQPVRRNLAGRTAGFLSRMSYTLYLCHLPALVFGCAVTLRPWHREALTMTSSMSFGCLLGIVFLYACLMFFCFEAHTDRVRRWLTRNLVEVREIVRSHARRKDDGHSVCFSVVWKASDPTNSVPKSAVDASLSDLEGSPCQVPR